MIKVTTETGSVYEFDVANSKMRRVPVDTPESALRRDGEWLKMIHIPYIEKEQPMRIPLEGLHDPTEVTMRYSTAVTKIEESD
jgi:hypothetical protein